MDREKKEQFLQHCKFYRKGEEDFPEDRLGKLDPLVFFFWEGEEIGYRYYGTEREREFISPWVQAGMPASTTNIYPPIIAAIFSIYLKGSDTPLNEAGRHFEEYFFPIYIASTVI